MTNFTELTSSDKLVHELTVATDASIGVICIRCPETEVYRVVDDLYALAMSQKTNFRLHTSELGWQEFARIDPEDTRAEAFEPVEPMNSDKSTADIVKAFEKLYTSAEGSGLPEDGFFVFLDLHYNFGEMATQTRIRKQAQRSLKNGQRIFIVVPHSTEIPEAISPLMHLIQFDYPTLQELSDTLDDVLAALDDEDKPEEFSEDQRAAIVSNGLGMTTNAFETAVAVSITEYSANHESLEDFSAEDIMVSIRGYKTQMLRKTNVLELQPTVPEEQIGGLDLFKEWMHQRKLTYTDKALENNVTPSRGALVCGPPGTGKSLVAKAAGSILNLPVIRFDVGRVFNQYVGQSEHAMRGVLSLIDAMSPCVLMVDEIDKGFGGMSSGGDGGTTQRVFGTFLTWMQERNQKNRPVFLIMTANRVHGLPPELLRRGRIDEIWSVNVPNDDEREAIIKIHLKKRNQTMPSGDLKACVRITKDLVGAEIEAMIEDALVLSLAEDKPGLTFELVEQAKTTLKEMSRTRAEEFETMQTWAAENARPASSPMLSSNDGGPKSPTVRRGRKKPRAKVTRQ